MKLTLNAQPIATLLRKICLGCDTPIAILLQLTLIAESPFLVLRIGL